MEEERRLMYVAITRAKERLYLTWAKNRYMYGKQNYSVVSRFLKELGYENNEFGSGSLMQNYQQKPGQNFNYTNFSNGYTYSSTNQAKAGDYAVGDRVFHTKFGIGYVTYLDEKSKIIKIDFDNYGNKVLSIDFAPIKKI